jgi:hypothetical protein
LVLFFVGRTERTHLRAALKRYDAIADVDAHLREKRAETLSGF